MNSAGVWCYTLHGQQVKGVGKGILSLPGPKPGHSLPTEIVGHAKSFYDSDDISRTMPGKKDYVSVKVDERRVHVQKRLVLGRCTVNSSKDVLISKSDFQSSLNFGQNEYCIHKFTSNK